MKKIGITTDCVCDLPDEYLQHSDVSIIYFYINTDTGRFRDGSEITSANVLEYLKNGGSKASTAAPSVQEYTDFFKENLERFDEIIHITISSRISKSYFNSTNAAKQMGEHNKRIHIIDSKHLSTGIGFAVIKAVEMQQSGFETEEIKSALEALIPNISTTFITLNADYLYLNGRVSRAVKSLCTFFNIHPVLTMKNGEIALKNVRIGNYERAFVRYIKNELKNPDKINTHRVFITHAGCSVKDTELIKHTVDDCCGFEELLITKASATISGNCGARTFGVLFVKNY